MNGKVNSQSSFKADKIGEITQQIGKSKDKDYLICKGQSLPYNTNETIGLLNILGLNKIFSNIQKDTLSEDIDVDSFDYNYKDNVLLFSSEYYDTYGIYISTDNAKTIILKEDISSYTGSSTTIKYNQILDKFLILGNNYISIWSNIGNIIIKAGNINGHTFGSVEDGGIINFDDKFIIFYNDFIDNTSYISTVTSELSVVNRKSGIRNVLKMLNVYEFATPLKYLCVTYYASTLGVYQSTDGINWNNYTSGSRFLDCSNPCGIIGNKFVITSKYGVNYITIEDIYNNNFNNIGNIAYNFGDKVTSYKMITINDLLFCTGYITPYGGYSDTAFWIIDKNMTIYYNYSLDDYSGYGGTFITSGFLWVKSGNESCFKIPLNINLPYYNSNAYIKVKSTVGGGNA